VTATPTRRRTQITPVIDCEPPPTPGLCPPPTPNLCPPPTPNLCPPPTHESLRAPRPSGPGTHRPHPRPAPLPNRAAVAFADAALRRVLEVIDRRRPVTQLRPLITPALTDTVLGLSRVPQSAAARLRRVRLRMVDGDDGPAAEVFGTYTRGPRVRAIAARITQEGERWRIVALEIG